MRFSDKSSPLLSLQKKHGRFWVDKIGASEEMHNMTISEILKNNGGTSAGWHEQSSKMFRDIFNNYDKFENVYLCDSVVNKAEGLWSNASYKQFSSCISGLLSIGDKFGCFFIKNDLSLVYGLYQDKIVCAMFSGDKIIASDCMVKKEPEWENSSSVDNSSPPLLWHLLRLLTIYFFAKIETKVVGGKEQRKAVVSNEKILNETGVPVKIVDCKWFTNIVRTEGFGVRGHFRLQPKKINGEWTHELIWIDDFEKHGYTSKARILNQEQV